MVHANDTVASVSQRVSVSLGIRPDQVQLLYACQVLRHDAQCPWSCAPASSTLGAVTYLVRKVDIEEIKRAIEAAMRTWCGGNSDGNMEYEFLSLEGEPEVSQ